MGAPKLKDYIKPVQLRPLKEPGKKRNPFTSFITLIVLVSLIISIINITNNSEEKTLEDFVEESIENKTSKQKKFILSKTTPKQNEKIKELTNVHVSNHNWVIDNFAVRHIFRRHPESSIDDFKKIYSLINSFDEIKNVSYNKKSVPELEINKIIDSKLHRIFIEVRKRELSITTFYKNKLKKPE